MSINRRVSVAPMMEWTDRHDRFFLRQISKHSVLYTEMVTTGAILFGDKDKHLKFHSAEHPVAVQLGGSNPTDLAECAKICEDYGYDEVNLNVGCPSDRVQNGKIGACLMAEPELVAECISAMRGAVSIPVTVKHRLGIDDLDSYELLSRFVEIVAGGGCTTFIVHARKAILSGLSPKQNREVPPLIYSHVYQLKNDFPQLEFILNGGVKNLAEVDAHLKYVDGVMIGREAYHNPFILADVDKRFYGCNQAAPTRQQVIESMEPYIVSELANGTRLQHIARHILGLFHSQPRGKLWRRYLSENAHKKDAGIEVIHAARDLLLAK
ncbi:tRNA dihydrouridine(20/20a) synthase DusA [Aliikangiella marina]|uniref:tRNA-dihydrouridine(20/20a) synthase n=1 Tax=Aliikangiella marina TaxID=1712262 RepID=A0A545TH08_9GAMM|nr:tRNA dihydrouridine(20/20a) synthase DusA [Aliikangiella marina]TQV76524.1 tRNA dihydrouridine(20/20a) synthase DusA [Aliikangiella marina]